MERAARARDASVHGDYHEAANLYREALWILYNSERCPISDEAESPDSAVTPRARETVADESLAPDRNVSGSSEPARKDAS